MESMFLQCKVLPSIDLSHFDTSKVTNFQFMFSQCEALTELDLSSFDTSNVTNVNNFSGMFNRCENIETIYVSDKFITPNEEMSCFMFALCKKLVGAPEIMADSVIEKGDPTESDFPEPEEEDYSYWGD